MPKKITRKTKQINPFKTKQKKYSKQDIFALIFALVAVGFLLLYSIYLLSEKTYLIETLSEKLADSSISLSSSLVFLSIIALVIAIIMSFIIYKIEKREYKWHALFIVSLFTFFTILPTILGILASLLYIKNHR